MNDNLPDVRELAPEGIWGDCSAWVRNVLARSALDFLPADARMRETAASACRRNRSAGEVARKAAQVMAQIDTKGKR